jgi:hypothetical protein
LFPALSAHYHPGITDDWHATLATPGNLVAMIIPETPGSGALTSLNMSCSNGLKGAEAGKALGDAIAANTSLKLLDISGGQDDFQRCDVEFVQTFSVGLRDNGALTSLNLSSNGIGAHRDSQRQWIVTPEGMSVVAAIFVPRSRCILCRPSCYR